jgi:hypothetical protein
MGVWGPYALKITVVPEIIFKLIISFTTRSYRYQQQLAEKAYLYPDPTSV